MPTRLILSAPATGKTQLCIEQIIKVSQAHPLTSVRVIVPDRLQAAYFRRRLAQSGGALGVYVGTFSDLYKNILERAGVFVPIASNALLQRLVRETLDDANLAHFAPLRTLPGFLLALRDAFAELKRALVYPEDFIEKTKNASPAQRELAQLYAAYQAKLKQLGWADREGLSWLAIAELKANPTLLDNDIRLLVVDGFDSFIGAQRQALQFITRTSETLITLEGEENSRRIAHRRFAKTLETLRKELSPEIITPNSESFLPPDILHIEKNIFEAGSVEKSKQAFLFEARSPADEAREALRWMKARMVRDEISPQECAIFTANPNLYQPLLRSAAREFGIPVRFTQSDALTSSPAIAALTSLLSLSAQNFKTTALFKVLRSPYFSFGFQPATMSLLEKISNAAQIVEGQSQWAETWKRLAPAKLESQPDLDDERALKNLPRGEEAQNLQKQLDDFFARLTAPNGKRSQTEWTCILEDLLDNLKFYENISTDRDELACQSLREALRALVMSESIAGARVVNFGQYLSDLQNVLEGAALDEPHVKHGDSVLLGNMREARGLRYQAVALLGFSEGIFPEVERPDPFLTEDLRETFGLDSRLQREQGSLFYQAITRANSHLLITRPYLSDDGETWEASPFWNAVKKLYEKEAMQTIRPDDPRPLADAASSQELLFWAVRRKGLPKTYAALADRWKNLQHARQVIHARRAKKAEGVYEGSTPNLKEILSQRYSPSQVWSASRLETYGSCPQMFYISAALGLDHSSPPAPGLDVMQMGSILHKILEEAFKTAQRPSDANEVLGNLPKIARQIFAAAPQDYGFRPSELWELEQEQFLAELEATIKELARASEGWTPFAYEQAFGINNAPPLSIQLDQEKIYLRGVIDRVDQNKDGELRVVDYKSGSSHLDKNDLENGRRLQLPLYALAARDALNLGNPVDGIYWAIKAAKAGSLKLASYEGKEKTGVEAAIETLKEHLQRIVDGVRAGEFSPRPPKGGCPEYCPAAQWCWRYQKGGWA